MSKDLPFNTWSINALDVLKIEKEEPARLIKLYLQKLLSSSLPFYGKWPKSMSARFIFEKWVMGPFFGRSNSCSPLHVLRWAFPTSCHVHFFLETGPMSQSDTSLRLMHSTCAAGMHASPNWSWTVPTMDRCSSSSSPKSQITLSDLRARYALAA